MHFRLFLFAFLILLHAQCVAQTDVYDPRKIDYSRADSVALNFPKEKYKTYTEVVGPLISGFQTQEEKFRVLFRWVTDNIAYSMGNKSADPDKALKKGKAVCVGYATLLQAMCTSAGIECVVISGYSKAALNDIGKKYEEVDHAWNAVKLNGEWYLLDATWASSAKDMDTKKYIKQFNEYYFLTPPEQFVKSHFPKEKKWQLLTEPEKKPEFAKTHIYRSGYFDLKITELTPHKGILKADMNDSLVFTFKSPLDLKTAYIIIGNERFITKHDLKKVGDIYTILQHIEMPGNYRLLLFIDEKEVAWYRLEVGK